MQSCTVFPRPPDVVVIGFDISIQPFYNVFGRRLANKPLQDYCWYSTPNNLDGITHSWIDKLAASIPMLYNLANGSVEVY